jgi:hypothetical protein
MIVGWWRGWVVVRECVEEEGVGSNSGESLKERRGKEGVL